MGHLSTDEEAQRAFAEAKMAGREACVLFRDHLGHTQQQTHWNVLVRGSAALVNTRLDVLLSNESRRTRYALSPS